MKIYIRNMACESCKVLVKEELKKIGKEIKSVELGEAEIKGSLNSTDKKKFESAIKKAGLEITASKEAVLIDHIKATITAYVDNINSIKVNLSAYITNKLNYDYEYISSYFSSMQATTIEQFMINLKIERAKEMLVLEDYTLTEIADKLGYKSLAHLSSQFKKVAGLPASHFKNLKAVRRRTIQQL